MQHFSRPVLITANHVHMNKGVFNIADRKALRITKTMEGKICVHVMFFVFFEKHTVCKSLKHMDLVYRAETDSIQF